MTLTIDVDDRLPSDLRLLAIGVLKGEDDAVRPFLDCALENSRSKVKVEVQYVDGVEDLLRNYRIYLRQVRPISVEAQSLGIQYMKLERWALSLGRSGLS